MSGLYIHVPFCTKKCHYCDFVIAMASPVENHTAFLTAIEEEARHLEPMLAGVILDTVYLGGGTPSVLSSDELERLFQILRMHFIWKKDAEVTCEVNPGDVDLHKAKLLKKLGANRISLGAQSFNNDTLEAINRTHRAAEIESSFQHLRDAGFHNISVDLILSLPGETWSTVLRSLEKLTALGPEHVSIYELTIEEKTVFGKLKKEGKLLLPSEEEQLETLSKTRLFLQAHGYRHYELLSYAKAGFESKHNLLYWANEDVVGLGPGAWSHFRGRRWRSSDSFHQYLSKIAAGDWSVKEEETLSEEKKRSESFVLALRLNEGAPIEKHQEVILRLTDEIASLTQKGLVTEENGYIRLTSRGQFFAETVFSELC